MTVNLGVLGDLTMDALVPVGAPGDEVVQTTDSRLSDARAPTAHTHVAADVTNFAAQVQSVGDPRYAPIGSGGATVSKLTADLLAATLTALTDTTGLSFAVTAGTYYRFQAYVIFRSAATTTGIKIGATLPAFTVYAATVRIPIAADGAGGELQGWLTSSGDSVVGSGVQATNTDYLAIVDGIVLPSANGTFQLQHATEVAASAVTVRRGSALLVTTL